MPATPSNADRHRSRAELSRRALLKLSLAASGLLAAGGLVEYLQYQTAPGASTVIELDRPSVYPPGSATHLREAGAWLLRDAGGLYAISTRCPHLGCTVERQVDGFRCPCHGSRFSLDGVVLNGPAARSLSYLTLSLSGQGHAVVHTDQTTEPSARLDA
jgi:Rieske Fe-S protein